MIRVLCLVAALVLVLAAPAAAHTVTAGVTVAAMVIVFESQVPAPAAYSLIAPASAPGSRRFTRCCLDRTKLCA
jgi:hypothetical protein